MRRLLIAGLAAGLLLGTAACRHHGKRGRDCCPPGGLLDDPVPRGGTIAPPGLPTTPPPASKDPLPPPVIPDSGSRSFSIDPRTPPGPWDPTPSAPPFRSDVPPAPGQREVLSPDPLPRGVPPEIPLSSKPSTGGLLEEPIRPNGAAAKPDRLLDDPTTRAPVGLPGFARVPGRDAVASGRKPTLDGFDWLKASGIKTVVYLHAPSADVAPARDLAEKRGLRFVPIAVSPGTLKKAFDEFAAAVDDRGNRPLYVIDEDGVRAGSLWYLLFRTRDLLGDDTARLRAAPLGLTDAATEEQKQLWIAVQDVLARR